MLFRSSNTIAEVIASTVAVINGADMSHLMSTFDSKTASSVSNALATIKPGGLAAYSEVGIIKF